jgi:sugar phosphate isomerase/epimerase
MPTAAFTLSAFGDEIADDLGEQLRVLRELRIGYLELRGAWGKNVSVLSDDEVEAIRRLCAERAIGLSCIGSPIGKSPLAEPLEPVLDSLRRLCQVATTLGTRRIRIFSFYPPEGDDPADHLAEATARLRRLATLAGEHDILLLLENELGIVGDTPERCAALLEAVDSLNLRFVWDTANFVQVKLARPVERGWPLLSRYLAQHVQIKDARLADGTVVPAGEGDAQVGELLDRLRETSYRGFLALEPHLAYAGPRGGFSGPDGMARAADALRRLLAARGCTEQVGP